jgi:hypothetical protein
MRRALLLEERRPRAISIPSDSGDNRIGPGGIEVVIGK